MRTYSGRTLQIANQLMGKNSDPISRLIEHESEREIDERRAWAGR